jgi:hypothetical protein
MSAFSIILITISYFVSVIAVIGYAQAQDSEYLLHRDTEGRFTIQYPSDWVVGEEYDESIQSNVFYAYNNKDESKDDGGFNLSMVNIPGNGTTPIENYTLENHANYLIQVYNYTGSHSPYDVYLNFTKYKIDGHKAFVVGFTYPGYENTMVDFTTRENVTFDVPSTKQMLIGMFVDDKSWLIEFASSPEKFDSVIPIFDKMINSIRIP